MKALQPTITYLGALLVVATLATACTSLLTKNAPSTSVPVLMGAATTNDNELVAYELAVKTANQQFNATQTEPLVDAGMAALITLTSAFVGWYARHQIAQQAIAKLTTPPAT